MTREEERELLELQAELARLKIQAAQLKRARNRARDRSHAAVHAFLNFKQLANSAGSLISNRQLFKIALLPTRWQYRLLLGGALLAWEYWRLQRDVRPVVYRRRGATGRFAESGFCHRRSAGRPRLRQ